MQFKKDIDKTDFADNIKPRLKAYLNDLDKFCLARGLPEVIVTSLMSPLDKHELHSEHYVGEAADIRAHHLTAPQLAAMYLWASSAYFRTETRADGMQFRCFYPHGQLDAFHVHLSIDHLG